MDLERCTAQSGKGVLRSKNSMCKGLGARKDAQVLEYPEKFRLTEAQMSK